MEFDGTVLGCYHDGRGAGVGDVADDVYFLAAFDFFVVFLVDGEKEFVVLATIEGVTDGEHVLAHLGTDAGGLVVDGQAFFVDLATALGLFADVEEFAGETVADINHGGGDNFFFGKKFDDIGAGFGFEVTFEDVVVAVEVGFEIGVGLEGDFFAFKDEEAAVGAAEVAADADEVVELGTAAVGDFVAVGFTDGRDGDDHAEAAARGVATDEVDIVAFAAETYAGVEFFQRLDGETVADGHADKNLARGGVHGADVAEVDGNSLVAKVPEWGIGHVEVDAFNKHIGSDDGFLLAGAQHCGIVAHALDGAFIHATKSVGKTFN